MKKLVMIAAMIAAFGLGTAAALAASSDKPPSPPGQDECEHGNSLKPCKEDPQPEHGGDCKEHGNQGGVNEDHCKGDETTPAETVPTTPTETNPTTPTETTSTETTSTETTSTQTSAIQTTPAETPAETTSAETTAAETTAADTEEEQQEQVSTSQIQKTTAAQSQPVSVAGVESATKPSKAAQPAPFTP